MRISTRVPSEEDTSRSDQLRSAPRTPRASRLFAAALASLVVAVLWALVVDRARSYEQERALTLNVAQTQQAHITEVLLRATYSLRVLQKRLETSNQSPEAALEPFRGLMHFDPVARMMGVQTAEKLFFEDGVSGAALLNAKLLSELTEILKTADRTKVSLHPVMYSPGTQEWLLPLVLPTEPLSKRPALFFTLVPVARLLENDTLMSQYPGAYFEVGSTKGTKLFKETSEGKVVGEYQASFNPLMWQPLPVKSKHLFEAEDPTTGEQTSYGVSRSYAFPFFLAVAVPKTTFLKTWLHRSGGHLLLLLVGTLSVLVVALRLHKARTKELFYLSRQEYYAAHDPLTGLLTRNAFQSELRARMEAQPFEPFVVILVGLHGLSEANETLGHHAGDGVLRQLGAKLIKRYYNGRSCVARLGEGIVVCVFPDDHKQGVEGAVQELHALLSEPISLDSISLEFSVSLGVAVCTEDATTPAELLRCAAIAMQEARLNLLPYLRYLPLMGTRSTQALELRADLAKAIREEGLSLMYQPKVDIKSGVLVGVEALSRWAHPVYGPVSPSTFIPLAEASELIHPFTEYVLRQAVIQCAEWRAQGFVVPVSVNVSTNNLVAANFVERTKAILEDSGLPPHLLEMEVTESAVMRNHETALSRLEQLKGLGVTLSIDDFGTGYSSLAYLKKLPVSVLKIDQTFLSALVSDEGDRRIVLSTIQLAQGFGMKVVAEGVESAAVMDLLREQGCDVAQGFFISKPLSAKDFYLTWLHVVEQSEECLEVE